MMPAIVRKLLSASIFRDEARCAAADVESEDGTTHLEPRFRRPFT
jgi:hypothetical protein